MAFFWPFGHEGQTFFDLLAKIQARHIKRSNDWGKTLFFKKTWCCILLNWVSYFFQHWIQHSIQLQLTWYYSKRNHHHIRWVTAVCTYISILPRSDMLRKMGNSNAKINGLKFKVCMLKFSSVPKYFISLFPPTNDFLFNDGSWVLTHLLPNNIR